MNLNVLRYVEAVAEEHSFTKAAARLFVAQPSLSQAIRALERDLGAELFDRSGRTVELTPSGERYLRWARTVLRSEKKLRAELETAPGGFRKLVVGASPYRCKALFPAALRAFCAKNPDCKIVLRDQYQDDLMLLLDEGKLDLVIDLPPAGGYQTRPVTEERILIAVPKAFPLHYTATGGAYPKVTLEELLAQPVILIDDAQYSGPLHLGSIQRRFYAEVDAVPDIAIECCSAEMAHILTAQGLGFTVISELFMRSDALPGVHYCEIAGQTLKRSVCAIWSGTRKLSEDEELLITLLRAGYADWQSGRQNTPV